LADKAVIAKKLIDVAKLAGCDAVKFQKRTPELCVPDEQKDLKRETPWGVMTYLEYRHRVEFGYEQYAAIDRHCKERGIDWFVSCWDEASVDFIEQFGPVCYKIASASVTDISLLDKLKATRRPLILSTGMSRMEEIRAAVEMLPADRLAERPRLDADVLAAEQNGARRGRDQAADLGRVGMRVADSREVGDHDEGRPRPAADPLRDRVDRPLGMRCPECRADLGDGRHRSCDRERLLP